MGVRERKSEGEGREREREGERGRESSQQPSPKKSFSQSYGTPGGTCSTVSIMWDQNTGPMESVSSGYGPTFRQEHIDLIRGAHPSYSTRLVDIVDTHAVNYSIYNVHVLVDCVVYSMLGTEESVLISEVS